MSQSSTIEWTEATWNPVTGCDKVSPGCAHCYAETFAERWRGTPGHPYEQGFDLKLWPSRLKLPLTWRKPKLIFVNSMSDLFHEEIPAEYVLEVFRTMGAAHQHTYQVLTKRPERMLEVLPWVSAQLAAEGRAPLGPVWRHVWLGVSIENRRFVERADLLRQAPAAVRFISAEPLLGSLLCDETEDNGWPHRIDVWSDGYDGEQLDLDRIDWLIVGGESGPKHRPIKPQWVRALRDVCLDSRCPVCFGDKRSIDCEHCHCDGGTGTAFFFKQWGGSRPKSNGRELDGRTWDEMPERAA